jgi:thymidylate synthase ThyX
MSADNEVSQDEIESAKIVWEYACMDAVKHARTLAKIGIHKQVVNRLLEPFSTITVICSGTTYQNFFEQRCHPAAQPEIQALANKMKAAYDASNPKPLLAGQWHRPFWDINDCDKVVISFGSHNVTAIANKISTGRCARVSYLNHDGDRSLSDDIKLHDRLLASKPAHLSPFEHIAIALPSSEKRANFTGFESYRYQIED